MAGGTRVQGQVAVALRMERMTPLIERELEAELDVCGQLIARAQRMRAPKFRSQLVNSIRVERSAPLQRDVGPTMGYAGVQEEGIRPGGKGLPRFSDPEAADVIAWLRTKAFGGRRIRPNTMSAVRADLELRDRYEGLAWHIRHRGVKATPFIAPSLAEMERPIRVRLQVALDRALTAGSDPA